MKPRLLLPALAAGLMLPGLLPAQTFGVPDFISYQGRVLDSTGAPVGTGTPVNRKVIFRVWNHSSNVQAANLIYSEEQTVTVADGKFSVLVGQGIGTTAGQFSFSETPYGPDGAPPMRISNAFNGSDRYLGVTVDDGTAAVDNEIAPRQQIVSSAFAFRSKYAETLGSGAAGSHSLTQLSGGSLAVSGPNTTSSTNNPQFLVTADDVTERLRIGVDSTGNGTSFLQSWKEGTGGGTGFATDLLLQPNGGNVAIGTAAPIYPAKLFVHNNANTAPPDTAIFHAPNIGPAASHIHNGTNGDIYWRSAKSVGKVILQDTGGNVGIGTGTPAAQLQVGSPSFGFASPTFQVGGGALGGTVGDTKVLGSFNFLPSGGNQSSMAMKAMKVNNGGGWLGTSMGLSYDVDGYAGPGGSIWFHNYQVGIGTASPNGSLDVEGYVRVQTGANDKGLLCFGNRTTGAGYFDTGIYRGAVGSLAGGNYLNLGSYAGIAFNTSAAALGAQPTRMFIDGNSGNVGIGTVAPTTAKLVVSGTGGSENLGAHYTYANTGVIVGGIANNVSGISIKASDAVHAAFYRALSDARIKVIEGVSDGAADLGTLSKIEITNYTYKDVIGKGKDRSKKVIAQQVEKVFPQAVSKSVDVVPDIYKSAKIVKGWVALATDLKKGERVRLINDLHDGIHEVLEVEKDRFLTSYRPDLEGDAQASGGTTATNPPANTPKDSNKSNPAVKAGVQAAKPGAEVEQVFVFGREVNDFRAVDYEAIAMLNVSATQELAKRVDALTMENEALKTKLAASEKLLSELKAGEKARDERLAAIEKLLSADKSSVIPVSLKTAAE